MPIRFSTEAANADHVGTDDETGAPDGMPRSIGADGTPRDRADRTPRRETRKAEPQAAQDKVAGKPGKDINAAGFVKDKDPA